MRVTRRKFLAAGIAAAGGAAWLIPGTDSIVRAAGSTAARDLPAEANKVTEARKPVTRFVSSATAAAVIAYATSLTRTEAGSQYVWGGTGDPAHDYGYDCSGLVQTAYARFSIGIPRTSEQQWADMPHVSGPEPGNLVFFPGVDGTWSEPGHVGLVIDDQWMVQAYAPGVKNGVYTYGLATSLEGIRHGDVIGYARPATT
jgi:cell wall-associated NlpC family hydrolase